MVKIGRKPKQTRRQLRKQEKDEKEAKKRELAALAAFNSRPSPRKRPSSPTKRPLSPTRELICPHATIQIMPPKSGGRYKPIIVPDHTSPYKHAKSVFEASESFEALTKRMEEHTAYSSPFALLAALKEIQIEHRKAFRELSAQAQRARAHGHSGRAPTGSGVASVPLRTKKVPGIQSRALAKATLRRQDVSQLSSVILKTLDQNIPPPSKGGFLNASGSLRSFVPEWIPASNPATPTPQRFLFPSPQLAGASGTLSASSSADTESDFEGELLFKSSSTNNATHCIFAPRTRRVSDRSGKPTLPDNQGTTAVKDKRIAASNDLQSDRYHMEDPGDHLVKEPAVAYVSFSETITIGNLVNASSDGHTMSSTPPRIRKNASVNANRSCHVMQAQMTPTAAGSMKSQPSYDAQSMLLLSATPSKYTGRASMTPKSKLAPLSLCTGKLCATRPDCLNSSSQMAARKYPLLPSQTVINNSPMFGDSADDLTLLDDIIGNAGIKLVDVTPMKDCRGHTMLKQDASHSAVAETISIEPAYTRTSYYPLITPRSNQVLHAVTDNIASSSPSIFACQLKEEPVSHLPKPDVLDFSRISLSPGNPRPLDNTRCKTVFRGLPVVEIMLPAPPPVLEGSSSTEFHQAIEDANSERYDDESEWYDEEERSLVGRTYDAVSYVLGNIILAPFRLFVWRA